MTGNIFLGISFAAVILTIILYLRNLNSEKSNLQAHLFYYLFVLSATIAFVVLFYLFLNNRFDYSYVYSYSSSDLPLHFKISALWAGQEGTFLLWLLISAWLGLWVMRKAGKDESIVMIIFILAQIFLYPLMFVKSPFAQFQITPVEGGGLNPLLQNIWMVIHPPVVFVGYAALSIPFAFSISALIRNDYENWVSRTLPWVAISVATLGAGIFLGGYWAYETLGWGGYWAWDPVENSSLVPWLFATALLHGMLVEKSRGALSKTNLFLSSTSYIAVVYATFLTRSGILSDFSVHSFIDLGLNNYLVATLAALVLFSWGLLIFRAKNIESQPTSNEYFSRDFIIYLTLLFLALSGAIVLFGTSAPIITGLMGKAASMKISYYVDTHLPLAILMCLAMSAAPFTSWKNQGKSSLLTKSILVIIGGAVAVLISAIQGIDFSHLILALFAVTAFTANSILLVDRIKQNPKSTGGMIAHAGFGIMLVGVIGSSGYSVSQHTFATRYEQGNAFDRSFQLADVQQITKDKKRIDLHIDTGEQNYTAKMYFTDSRSGEVRTPFIKKFMLYDLYLSPGELEPAQDKPTVTLSKGETAIVGKYRVIFQKFVSSMDEDQSHSGSITALVNLVKDGDTLTVKPSLELGMGSFEPVPAKTEFGGTVSIEKVFPDQGRVTLSFGGFSGNEQEPSETLFFQVSKKPLINLVWLGSIMMILGSLVSFWRRYKIKV
ncbi:MAG: hypothetical protein GF307_04115 [candidate division Zixibacteria bacterium]|nr:hypothetical protein [candidate division Zixibacteria bacterium]